MADLELVQFKEHENMSIARLLESEKVLKCILLRISLILES